MGLESPDEVECSRRRTVPARDREFAAANLYRNLGCDCCLRPRNDAATNLVNLANEAVKFSRSVAIRPLGRQSASFLMSPANPQWPFDCRAGPTPLVQFVGQSVARKARRGGKPRGP